MLSSKKIHLLAVIAITILVVLIVKYIQDRKTKRLCKLATILILKSKKTQRSILPQPTFYRFSKICNYFPIVHIHYIRC